MAVGVDQAAAVVVPGDHEVALLVDGGRREQLEGDARPDIDEAPGPVGAKIRGAGDHHVGLIVGEVAAVGGDDVDVPGPHGVGQHPRLRRSRGRERGPGDLAGGGVLRLKVMSDWPGARAMDRMAEAGQVIVVPNHDGLAADAVGSARATVVGAVKPVCE